MKMSGEITLAIRRIKPEIGEVTTEGIIEKAYPLDHGNSFSFTTGHYCLNMWAENLESYCKDHELDQIEILEIKGTDLYCLVVDKRIPKKLLNKGYNIDPRWNLQIKHRENNELL